MRKFLMLAILCLPFFVGAALAAPTLSVFPQSVIQGEPLMISIGGVSGLSTVRKVSFAGKAVGIFLYNGKPSAFVGIDLNKKPGGYRVAVTLSDGAKLEKIISVGAREKVEAPLGIPEKLGGNTPAAAAKLVSLLDRENQILNSLKTFPKSLWSKVFNFPIENPTVTDPYGYSRQTVFYSIPHKGTDFRAAEGTPIVAMNRGIIRLARTLTAYGKTVVIDHGQGLFTFYMHLSKVNVNEGELVQQGRIIGLSGKTGYAESPHLHLTVRVGGTSIDPMRFMDMFKQN